MQNTEPGIIPVDPSVTTPPVIPSFTHSSGNAKTLGFKFYGSASEYFGIWIVNILLTIVTLSLYAPWAKVRRLRYFYGNTEFYNRKFDFTGIPRKILIGRLIAIGLYIGISLAAGYSPKIAGIGALLIYLAVPWLLRATIRFTARNSKYGNSRFYFGGSTLKAYIVFFLALLLTIVTLGLFFPVAIWLYKRYTFNHLFAGQLPFTIHTRWTTFMGAVYLPLLAFIIIVVALVAVSGISMSSGLETIGSGAMAVFGLIYTLAIFFLFPLIAARIYIATWKNVTLGNSKFDTSCNQWRYAWIEGTNILARIVSVGFLSPWAAVRSYRYKVDNLTLNMVDDPDQLYNIAQQDHSALAEEISDIFDLDISL
ncbi:YjgN family protein [Acinetobacter chinensis]|jgi:uncharacterized membrane protein YjgN (DUF898 family)|uniref:YjgN family protein n=1 Tax=Acinetobacter chinensis TaxID=2004650 RepID=A0ABU3WJB3_9GAMM|nr:YjgN family protein [Acinetobacter chinensis]MDV2470504.1 YjgN family protein [Acinetobacter chinensis]WOE42230.1 YjgN family protein [Acinetobacter chinensis]